MTFIFREPLFGVKWWWNFGNLSWSLTW